MEESGERPSSCPSIRESGQRNPRYSGTRGSYFPLRILVQSDMVGAIIGRSGSTIRSITQETHAKVDVHRRDTGGSLEKVITIYGSAESCSRACAKIMQVMHAEASNTATPNVPLKMLAHNNLIGRIIGKSGNTIKGIMEQTNTRILVSNKAHGNLNIERVITIEGELEDISAAEKLISSKLIQFYENDLKAMVPQTLNFPGLHPVAMMSALGSSTFPPTRGAPGPPYGLYGSGSYLPPPLPYGPGGPPPLPLSASGSPLSSIQQEQTIETVHLYIPNSAVGAIIGRRGCNIRDMINSSGASIKVSQSSKEERHEETSRSPEGGVCSTSTSTGVLSSLGFSGKSTERKITIVGNPDAQWKAQLLIFRKIGSETSFTTQEPALKIEIMIPSSQVGRVIGKKGQNVQKLQKFTHALIKLPEESQSSESEETPVLLFGDFLSTQAAQRYIRNLVNRGLDPSAGARTKLKSSQSQGRSQSVEGEKKEESKSLSGEEEKSSSSQQK